jgi:hypothetical protein
VTVRYVEHGPTTTATERTVKPNYFRRRAELEARREFRRALNQTLEPGDLVTVESTAELIWSVVAVDLPREHAELSTTIFEMPDRRHTASFAEIDRYFPPGHPGHALADAYVERALRKVV